MELEESAAKWYTWNRVRYQWSLMDKLKGTKSKGKTKTNVDLQNILDNLPEKLQSFNKNWTLGVVSDSYISVAPMLC